MPIATGILTLGTLTADGATPAWRLCGKFAITVQGTWGSGTHVLQTSVDNGTTWITVADSALTTNGSLVAEFGRGELVRGSLSGATAPSLTVCATIITSGVGPMVEAV